MSFSTIKLSIDTRGVATVTLARPDKHNVLNAEMNAELHQVAEQLGADASIRAVVLAAEGKSFCAGGDLAWMQAQAEKNRAGKVQEALNLAHMLGAWYALPKLVVARVQGQAFGGGVGLISTADIAVGVESAKFAMTETKLGLIHATIGPFVVRRLGEGFARRVVLNAKIFDAEFALRSGLLSRVVPEAELDAAVEEEISSGLQCAPGAVADAKALTLKLGGPDPRQDAEMTANALADRWETDEGQHGIAAFFARTKPDWAGQ